MLLLIAGVGAVYLFRDQPMEPSENSGAPTPAPISKPEEKTMNNTSGSPGISWLLFTKEDNKSKGANPEDIHKMFHSDERDNLVLNKDTRINIEQLYALNTPEELDEKLQKLSTDLPSAAHRQLVNLIDYFDKYLRDLKQLYPPDVEPVNVEQALEQLQAMHALRVRHFGADVAEALFAEDEKTNRQLLEFMLKDPDKNATLQEKAERAQQALQHMQSNR